MKEVISNAHIRQFINDGYIRIENAFSEQISKQCRDILWNDLGLDPNKPETWTKPVIRLGMYTQEPFVKAANSEILHHAFNRLVGEDKWAPCMSMGSFPIRFPSAEDAGDTGWHVDAGFPGDDPGNYFEWRINVESKGRALLMLFLFSDVGENDAPTRIKVGSHLDVAALLQPEGEKGLSFIELAKKVQNLPDGRIDVAMGKAGTVYLCHPFLVHAAQRHNGTQPKFMAQPPLILKNELQISHNTKGATPLEKSIIMGLK
ncbi:MAG TPA: phytanoyl-CoA dioxygenase [Sphingobacteriaceae bacterium]